MELKMFDTKNRVKKVVDAMKPSKNDPSGSFTGKPIEQNEKPVQDADDL
jgi:hypothetical protein